jgi:hypothetical protein
MPRYEIQITDMTGSRTIPAGDGQASLAEADLVTVQDAPNEQLAKDWAWRVWDSKYGPSKRPSQFRLGIRRLEDSVRHPGA